MGDGVEGNYSEAKELRRVLVDYADASLRVMETSFAVVPPTASSPIIQRGAEASPTEPGPQDDAHKLGRKRRHAKKAAIRKPEPQPAIKSTGSSKKMRLKTKGRRVVPPA